MEEHTGTENMIIVFCIFQNARGCLKIIILRQHCIVS